MPRTLGEEIKKFRRSVEALAQRGEGVEELAKDVFVLCPPGWQPTPALRGKRVALTLLALIHGNETCGLAVLNEFLSQLLASGEPLPISLGLALGNHRAATLGERFAEKDLNRSFGTTAVDLHEQRRARELEHLLDDTRWLVDFHQTILPNAEPFFIFPYTRESYQFARALTPEQPIVTHWEGSFSKEGMCSDEYVNRQGGCGITIETGRAGFDPYQIGYGFMIALRALVTVRALVYGSAARASQPYPGMPLYTWAHTEPYPSEGEVHLKPSLYNFAEVTAGEALARLEGGRSLYAPHSGKILFPKYLDPAAPPSSRPTELLRILKPIAESDLPS